MFDGIIRHSIQSVLKYLETGVMNMQELSDTNVVDHNTHNYSQSSESDFAFQVID